MLRVLRDVRLPDVFEVVVVAHRAAPLHLRDNSFARADTVEKVGSGPGDDAVLRGQQHFFVEPEVVLEDGGDDGLDRSTASSVNVSRVDRRRLGLKRRAQRLRQPVYSMDRGEMMILEN